MLTRTEQEHGITRINVDKMLVSIVDGQFVIDLRIDIVAATTTELQRGLGSIQDSLPRILSASAPRRREVVWPDPMIFGNTRNS